VTRGMKRVARGRKPAARGRARGRKPSARSKKPKARGQNPEPVVAHGMYEAGDAAGSSEEDSLTSLRIETMKTPSDVQESVTFPVEPTRTRGEQNAERNEAREEERKASLKASTVKTKGVYKDKFNVSV
jgi:hypothetical protein